MFDIGWSEMAIVLLIALIVVGPRDLPKVARTVGKWAAKGRAMAREFQNALEDMARETELDTVKKEIEKVGRTDIGKTIEKTVDPSGKLSKAFDTKVDSAKDAAATTERTSEEVAKAADPANDKPAAAATSASAAVAPENGTEDAGVTTSGGAASEPVPVEKPKEPVVARADSGA